MDARERHLKLLTGTIEAVNSTLDLEEVLSQVASGVAEALDADACFVYLYDERSGELVLRATHGTKVEEMTHRPRMRPGEGITGSAAELRAPVMIPRRANLDARFKNFPNLVEDEYESILAVPILARGERLEGALNLRTREPREFSDDEIDLLLAIAAQVAQSIEHAKLYAEAQRRVHELEALARISQAVSEALYLEESLEAIVKTTMDALAASGAALVLEDGKIAWPEGHADVHAIRQPLRWRGRTIGELVADRGTPFTDADADLLASIAQQAAVALEHGRAVMRGVLAQEIHHRVKNNLQTVAALLRLQARRTNNAEGREALMESVRRVAAIAQVHEALSMSVDEEVNLDEVIDRILPIMNDVARVDTPIRINREGSLGVLDADRAMALVMVVTELAQNAIEHAFDPADKGGRVVIRADRSARSLEIVVDDDGRGLPEGFSLEASDRLGLQIVRTLVTAELDGSLEMRRAPGGGTNAVLRVPIGRRAGRAIAL